jgi:hypothetical protein
MGLHTWISFTLSRAISVSCYLVKLKHLFVIIVTIRNWNCNCFILFLSCCCFNCDLVVGCYEHTKSLRSTENTQYSAVLYNSEVSL